MDREGRGGGENGVREMDDGGGEERKGRKTKERKGEE